MNSSKVAIESLSHKFRRVQKRVLNDVTNIVGSVAEMNSNNISEVHSAVVLQFF